MSWYTSAKLPSVKSPVKQEGGSLWTKKAGKRTRKLTVAPEAKNSLAYNAALYSTMKEHRFLTRTPPDIRSREHDYRRLNKSIKMRAQASREKAILRTRTGTGTTVSGSPLRLEQLDFRKLAVSPNNGMELSSRFIPPPGTPDTLTLQQTPFTTVSMFDENVVHIEDHIVTAPGALSVLSRTAPSVKVLETPPNTAATTFSTSAMSNGSSERGPFDLGKKSLNKVQMALDGNYYEILSKQYYDESTLVTYEDALTSWSPNAMAIAEEGAQTVVQDQNSFIIDPVSTILRRKEQIEDYSTKIANSPRSPKTKLFDPFTMHERFFAAVLIQKRVRGMLVRIWIVEYRRRTTAEFLAAYHEGRRYAAQQIQKITRGRQARIRFTRHLVSKILSDPFLVDFFPVLRPGSKASERQNTGKPLQLTIGELRGLYTRLVYLGQSAIQIQRIFRGTWGRVQAVGRAMDNARIELERDAATFLQSYIRRWIVRKIRVKQMIWYRHRLRGSNLIRIFVLRNSTIIQSFSRKRFAMYWYKNTLRWILHTQRIARGVAGRKRLALMQSSALVLQCAVRTMFAKIVFGGIYEKTCRERSLKAGLEGTFASWEKSVDDRYFASVKIESVMRMHMEKKPYKVLVATNHLEFGHYKAVRDTVLPDRKKAMHSNKFQLEEENKSSDGESFDFLGSDVESKDDQNNEKNEDVRRVDLSPLEQRLLSCRELLSIQLINHDTEWVNCIHQKQNLLLGRMALFGYSKALTMFVDNPRQLQDAHDQLQETHLVDLDRRWLQYFFAVTFYTWKHDKTNPTTNFHLALVYRYFKNNMDRADKFFRLAERVSPTRLLRTHIISQHISVFNEEFAKNLDNGDMFRNLLYHAPQRIDGMKLEIRILRFGDHLCFCGQSWDLVKVKRRELIDANRNDYCYAIPGVKEYKRIMRAEEVVETLRHLDRPRLIRPRYGEQLAKAFLPMLTVNSVKGKGKKMDVKFRQEPWPKMTMVSKIKNIYLTLVISQDDGGGLRISAISEDGSEYKAWFMYKDIVDLFLDYPVLWYHRKLPGWRDKGDKLLQMLVQNLELIDRVKHKKRVVKDKYELSRFERDLYDSGTLTEEVKFLSLEFYRANERKTAAKKNFKAMVIQAYWRGTRGRVYATLYKIFIMATKVRNWWRHQRARYFLKDFMVYSKRHWAATKIQKYARAYNTKAYYGEQFGRVLRLEGENILMREVLKTLATQRKRASLGRGLSSTISCGYYNLTFGKNAEAALSLACSVFDRYQDQPLILYLRAISEQYMHPEAIESNRRIANRALEVDPGASSLEFYWQTFFERYSIIHPNCGHGLLNRALVLALVYNRYEDALAAAEHAQKVFVLKPNPWTRVVYDGPEIGPRQEHWLNQRTGETTEIGVRRPKLKGHQNAIAQANVFSRILLRKNQAITTIQTYWRGSIGRREGLGAYLKMLVKQRIALDKVAKYKAMQEQANKREQEQLKLERRWHKYNEKMMKKMREEPISLLKFKRILACARDGIEYASSDYATDESAEESVESSVNSENIVVIDDEAAEQYCFHKHFFVHDYEQASNAYADFIDLLPENRALQVGQRLLVFFSIKDEITLAKALQSFSEFSSTMKFERKWLHKITRNVLEVAMRQHRLKNEVRALAYSYLSFALWNQLLIHDYFKALENYRLALAILPNDLTITCNYEAFIDAGHGSCVSPVLLARQAKIQRAREKKQWRREKNEQQRKDRVEQMCFSILEDLIDWVELTAPTRDAERKRLRREQKTMNNLS